ncbi:unnamed protein product [Lupinus luteus]|uniref:Uncharacterized protein n=1 Tax=Lupinus luteus TaxID=3873 RepID=A0AAV1W7Y0_LUPLU
MGIHKIYGTRHIGHDHVRSLVGLMDFFCFSETPQLGCACPYSTCYPESPSIFCGLYSTYPPILSMGTTWREKISKLRSTKGSGASIGPPTSMVTMFECDFGWN